MIKPILSIVALTLLSIPSIYSKTISLNEAKSIASNWKSNSALSTRAVVNSNSPELALELTDATTEEPALWVFNYAENNGYVIVAADDMAANTVLGYSDEGTFNQNDVPEGLKYWLDEYARQIEFLRNNPELTEPITRAFDKNVQPIIQTKWNQGNPYNLLCPELNGQLSVTGCVATALSQIMYFHKTPQGPGEGSISYRWTNGGINLSEDFTKVAFDWGNMTLTYTTNSTQAQKLAVAQLMQVVGYACQMGYSPSASGARNDYAAGALIKNFKYTKGIRPVLRDYFALNEFEGIIVDELNAGRPVYYSGFTSSSGHAFVCDGYNTDGYFHINWGWGGSSDGYFLTSALGPNAQGIGGSNGAYNYDQIIYTNIIPRDQDDSPYQSLFLNSGTLRSSASSVALGGSTVCSLSDNVYNYGLTSFTPTMGMGIFNQQDEMISVSTATGTSSPLQSYYGRPFPNVTLKIPSDIEDGTYFVRPVYQLSGSSEWDRIRIILSNPQSIIMQVKNKVATFSIPTIAALSASNFNKTSNEAKKPYSINVDIKNSGMTYYHGDLRLIIRESEASATNLAESDIVVADIEAGESKTYTFVGNAPSHGGDLVVLVLDNRGNKIGAQTLYFEKGEPNITAVRASEIYNPNMKTVKYTCYLSNSGGDYNGKIYLRFYLSQGGNTLLNTYEQDISIKDTDGTKEFVFEFEPENPIANASYTCILLIDIDGTISEITQKRTRKVFTMSDDASVETVLNNNSSYSVRSINGGVEVNALEATNVRIYNASGSLVAYSPVDEGTTVINLPAGFYIVLTDTGYTSKIIVK